MEDILSHFLDPRVTEELIEIGPDEQPITTVLYGISVQVEINGDIICKRTTGPFITKECNVILKKYYKSLKTKGKKDHVPLTAEELNQILPVLPKIDTAKRRVMEIIQVLRKKDKSVVDHLGDVIYCITHHKRTAREQFKKILSQAERQFDATEAVDNFLNNSLQIETVEAEIVEETVKNTVIQQPLIVLQPTVQQAAIQGGAVQQVAFSQLVPQAQPIIEPSYSPASINRNIVNNPFQNLGAIQFDNLEELMATNPDVVTLAMVRSHLLQYIKRDPKTGKKTLKILNYSPESNYLDFYLVALVFKQAKVSIDHHKQCLNIRKVFIEFLTEAKYISIKDGRPFMSFETITKPVIEDFDNWMLNVGKWKPEEEKTVLKENKLVLYQGGRKLKKDKKIPKEDKFTRGTASKYLIMVREVFHMAQDECFITNDSHPFRGQDRFKIPVPEEQDRSVEPEDMARFLEHIPSKKLMGSGYSHEWAWDMFVASTMLYGIGYMDFWSLEKDQVQDGCFVFRRAKIVKRGGRPLRVTVLIDPFTKAIMEKYRQPDNPKSNLYFPFLNLTEEEELELANVQANEEAGITLERARQQLFDHIRRKKVNALLGTMGGFLKTMVKKITKATGSGFKKKMEPYSSRSTFANSAIDQGVPPLRIMQALGQRTFEAFMHYANARLSKKNANDMVAVFYEQLKHIKPIEEIRDDKNFVEGVEKFTEVPQTKAAA